MQAPLTIPDELEEDEELIDALAGWLVECGTKPECARQEARWIIYRRGPSDQGPKSTSPS